MPENRVNTLGMVSVCFYLPSLLKSMYESKNKVTHESFKMDHSHYRPESCQLKYLGKPVV